VSFCAAAVALLIAASHLLHANSDSPGDRYITSQASLYLPNTRWSLGDSLKEISEATNVLFGLEAVADPSEKPSPRSSRRRSLRGLQVSQALNLLTQLDSRYGWREIDGVINVRPKDAFDDPQHFLHRFVAHFQLQDALPLEATFAVHRIFRPSCEIRHPVTNRERDEYVADQPLLQQRLLNLQIGNTTVLDILNDVVREHGGLHWNVSYPDGLKGYENSNFAFSNTPQSGGWWRMCVGDGP
jgi:hypothetical protein